MKTYRKTLFRTVKSNLMRMLIIICIVMIGVSLSTGLGSISGQLDNGFNKQMNEQNYPDLIIKNIDGRGFSQDLITSINEINDVIETELLFELDDKETRTIIMDFKNNHVNQIVLKEGRLPESLNEILVEESNLYLSDFEIGQTIKYSNSLLHISNLEVKVVGIVNNMMYIPKLEIYNNQEVDTKIAIQKIIYFGKEFLNLPIETDLYIKVKNNYNIFSKEYKKMIEEIKNEITSLIDNENYYLLTHEEMMTPNVIKANMDKMDIISLIFPLFFTLVIIIVVLTTMTRLIEDDRSIAATYISLGFSKFNINFRYYLIALISGLIGSILGLFLGYYTLGKLVFSAFHFLLVIPDNKVGIHLNLGIYVSVAIIVAMISTVIIISTKALKEKPANLLRAKAPKPGSKVFLEYIPFIWKKLKFKYKSSLRNILRYPLHFIMTIIAVSGSTMLLFAGLGLFMNTSIIADSTAATIELIAVIIIFAAAGLSILVTYNLTNMNIDERKREIATLKVLGYKKTEVVMYIFREVFITAIIGIVIGLPLGYLFVDIVFEYIEFGSVDNIKWYIYIITVLGSVLFIIVTDLLLYRKINKIDMNSSLKTIE